MKYSHYCALILLLCSLSAARAQERCGLGKDLMVRALERIHPGSQPDDLEGALQLLKQATEQCSDLGNAWYYRSLIEKQLGHQQQANYALGKAKMFGADALGENLDPFVLATAPTTEVTGPPGPVRDKWALVIGIGKFGDPGLNLHYTTKDAKDFAAILTDKNYGRFKKDHVHLLLDEQATTRSIKTELNLLARSAGRDDLVLIYLASHGSARESDIGGVNYVITYDTEVGDADSLYATALPMVELVNVVRNRVKARRAVVLLDTCHSGGALAPGSRGVAVIGGVNPSAASEETLNSLRQGEGRAIIASSRVNESSYESSKLQNGYFTFFLIRAFMQDQGRAPIGQIFESVKTAVSTKVLEDLHRHQTPTMSRSDQITDIVVGADIAGLQAAASHP